MKKRNVERDLFKILKSKNSDEIYYAILNMVNNTYNYEFRYLNRVSYDERMIYLEKIIMIGSGYKKINTSEDMINAILQFSQNLSKLSINDIRSNNIKNISCSLRVFLNRMRTENRVQKISSMFLAVVIFLSLYNHSLKASGSDELSSESLKKSEYSLDLKNMEESRIDTLLAYKDSIENPEVKELSVEEKIEIILEKFNLTSEQFNVLCAIVLTEAKPNSYSDAYAVINTIYNRTRSKAWVYEINKAYDIDVGNNLYYQAIHPNQFIVYQEGYYLRNMNIRDGEAFTAIIDFLYSLEIMHDYLFFRSCNTTMSVDFEQFDTNGNKYYNRLREEDRIIEEELSIENTR